MDCDIRWAASTNNSFHARMLLMPDGAIIFSDLIGKLVVLRVSCDKRGRDGCYGLGRLIERRGRDAKLVDWLDAITADCAKKRAGNMNDRCGARCPQLPKVLQLQQTWEILF